MKRIGLVALAASAFVATGALADGIEFPLDPDQPGENNPLILYSNNTNDGYSSFRGMVFTANEDVLINGAALFTQATNPLGATFELYTVVATNGNVLAGATLERQVRAELQGDLGFHGTKFDPFVLIEGDSYLLRVGYSEAADENWFNDFDPNFFGDPPVDLGPVTLIDGTLGGDTSNFVAPFMALQIVPAPGALALLGAAGLVARRRRRA